MEINGNDLYSLLTKIKKFEDRSNTRYTEQWNRIKDDKEFLWAKPLSTDVSKFWTSGLQPYVVHWRILSVRKVTLWLHIMKMSCLICLQRKCLSSLLQENSASFRQGPPYLILPSTSTPILE